MDEPFGAVDEITRRTLQEEMLKLQENLKKTIVFVTHDIEEAFKLGTKIVLFDSGKIVQQGTKEEMLLNPKNEFVENFFGTKNFTAYLNITTIKTAITPVSKEKNIYSIKDDCTLLEGIKALFNYGADSIGVEDKEGRIIGEFALRNVKREIV